MCSKYLGFILLAVSQLAGAADLSDADVGRMLFFDTNLSATRTMSCATCHDPSFAFTDHRDTIAKGIVSQGADGHSFGMRNAPTAAYANTSPPFKYMRDIDRFVGGQFWNGRASTLAQQSLGPPLDAHEMAMPSAVEVVKRLQENPVYVEAFKAAYGNDIFYIQEQYSKYRKLSDPKDQPNAFVAMGNFIEAFEKTDYFSPYDSKYDRYLAGQATLTTQEEAGRKLFFEDKDVSCRNCHMSKQAGETKEPFTNHQYYNVGMPSNPELLALHPEKEGFVDEGAWGENTFMKEKKYRGVFKVPTLRNIAITNPYSHNGYFKDLRTVIEYLDHYNNPARTINPETGQLWAKPEIADNLDLEQLKGRPLTDQDIDNLVAFLRTLTDKRYETMVIPYKK